MVAAERCHPFAGKAIAVSGAKIIAVEKASDHIVAANAREQADCFDDFLCCAVALSTPSARQAQFGMNAAHPVHDENDLSLLGIEVGDHFAKELAHDALLRSDVGRRLTPDRLQIERQRHELFGARRCFRRRLAHCFSIRLSSSATRSSASSNSAATSRLAGSVASYWRNALSAA